MDGLTVLDKLFGPDPDATLNIIFHFISGGRELECFGPLSPDGKSCLWMRTPLCWLGFVFAGPQPDRRDLTLLLSKGGILIVEILERWPMQQIPNTTAQHNILQSGLEKLLLLLWPWFASDLPELREAVQKQHEGLSSLTSSNIVEPEARLLHRNKTHKDTFAHEQFSRHFYPKPFSEHNGTSQRS